ncbi:MAG: alpha/beta hydrolase [Silicimonas sp.]|jgi:hypothetical protein|nr:alpha/beta hydrolase [Silicimonas sp.]
MLPSLFLILSTSYAAWYLERFELAAVYPFDKTYSTPLDAGAPDLTETATDTADGARLVIWRAEARDGLPTVVYFSGNAGSLKDRVSRFRRLAERGFGIVAPAYRGSSGSTGQPDEALLVEDARRIAGTLSGTVVLYGESLGAAVAIQVASAGIGDAVVLEAPFTSITDLVATQFPTEDLGDAITQRWDSLAAVGALRQPLLIIHGDADRIVPVEMGQRIFDAAGSADKAFISAPGHGHTTLWASDLQGPLFDFLGRHGN